ncbi:ATP-binding cassette domain-containing protein [Actinacidiphila acidipaludis]|uniref:ATP-binding cassette domain-containing protein n=1 Tax=Actinacidiphila acidipaludis TaxID=2873382 RepID=A0ABS7Q685_9ACTN|nr:ATP-binding cassette domain-containing protein [Streptomyces acidipaludis]MBY8878661.1 ATP-binding cassette domain-containing protein [Streptomyces acidipaludis]
MIQAIGLTSVSRRDARPAVADLSFEVRRGEVTGLLGPAGAGKSTVLRLLLGVEAGRGATLVDGRPLQELAKPAQEIGALIGDVPAHPRRSARGHLRMLCPAFGVPLSRADEVLDLVGLEPVADELVGTYSLGMDRRLGFAVALLASPRALILDDPARELPPTEAAWVHDLARRHAAAGGAVLLAGRDARALARTADRVIALDRGRIAADEPAEHFARSRMRSYVAVRSPYAQRLGELLAREGAEVVPTSGSRIAVYGATSAVIGETAYRNGILLHQLADRTAESPAPEATETASADPVPAENAEPRRDRHRRFVVRPPRPPARVGHRDGPARPFGYEVRRGFGVRTPWIAAAVALLCSAVGTILMARYGSTPRTPLRLLSGWSSELPLPGAAIGAGGLGALTYGQEYLYPALAPGYGPEPRSSRLLAAKLALSGGAALVLAALAAVVDVALLHTPIAGSHAAGGLGSPAVLGGWAALAVGCAWAGVLAAAVFRTTALGVAAVLAVPLLAVPAARALLGEQTARELLDAGGALWSIVGGVPQGDGSAVATALKFVSQPFVLALGLSLTALLGAYTASALLGRRRARRSTPLPESPSAPLTSKKG